MDRVQVHVDASASVQINKAGANDAEREVERARRVGNTAIIFYRKQYDFFCQVKHVIPSACVECVHHTVPLAALRP